MSSEQKPPTPPYYAVIFSSQLRESAEGYQQMADKMVALASEQPGFLGMRSLRDESGEGITISYWRDEQAILTWKSNAEHQLARQRGRLEWYRQFRVEVCRVERAYALEDD